MPLIQIKAIEFERIFCRADFLGSRTRVTGIRWRPGVTLDCSHKLWKTM